MIKKQIQRKVKEAPSEEPKTISRGLGQEDPFEVVEQFTQNVWSARTSGEDLRVIVGIDPGMTGAIGLLYPRDPLLSTAVDIPTTVIETSKKTKTGKRAKRTKFDLGGCKRIFDQLITALSAQSIVVALEQGAAQSRDSGLTGFSIGVGYGMWTLYLQERQLRYEELLPAVWKYQMNLRGKDKEWSRLMAQRLFPNAPLWRKRDHNRAEALLIAEAFRRKYHDYAY